MQLRFVSTWILIAIPLTLSLVGCDSGGTGDEGSNDTDAGACSEAFVDKEGGVESIMDAYGAPCDGDDDCTPLLGNDAFCVDNILGTFDFPGGYCTTPCDVPEGDTFVKDSEQCQAGGGLDCVGIQGNFTACAPPCDNHSQCGREAYGCVTMPLISGPGDPTYCLMNEDACCTDDAAC